MILAEFKCDKCDEPIEKRVEVGTLKIDCPKCGGKARKVLLPTVHTWKHGHPK